MTRISSSRLKVRNLVESTGFRVFIFIVILLNAVTIGLQTTPTSIGSYIPEIFDRICLTIYIIEAGLKFYAYRLDYFRDGWNIFDFSIIVLSLFATTLLPVPVQFMRVIRLVRVARMLKVVSLFNQMHLIVEAIGKSVSGVIWAALLLVVIIYIYDVLGVSAFGADYPEFFGNLGIGTITLFEIALDGWPDVAHDISAEQPWAYVYFISYVVCSVLVVLNVVVGIIVDAISESAQDERNIIARGLQEIDASNHVLILGFNSTTFLILNELVEANWNQKEKQSVVVLANEDKDEMDMLIKEHVGGKYDLGRTEIYCRTGLPYDMDALRRCAVETSRAVIVNTDSDTETIKAVMACTCIMNNALNSCNSYSIAAVRNVRYETSIKLAGKDDAANDRLELIPMQNILARIMVNASRQPGLSAVFTELFNFSGNEFYITEFDPSFSCFYGKSISEINLCLRNAIAIGVEHEGAVLVAAPHAVTFEQGDSLILLEEDDDVLSVLDTPFNCLALKVIDKPSMQPMRALVLGNYSMLDNVLKEYALYLAEGSTIAVVGVGITDQTAAIQNNKKTLEKAGITLSVSSIPIYDKNALHGLLAQIDPHCVLILGEVDPKDPAEEDNRIIELILLLRDYRDNASHGFGIVSQINLDDNRALVDRTGSDDYIVSRHFAALLMTQVSQKRELLGLFNEILSSDGFEVYIKKASDYVPTNTRVDLFSVGAAVADHNEIFIGLRQKQGGRYWDPIVNPKKFESDGTTPKYFEFSEDDYFVVLAEDGS